VKPVQPPASVDPTPAPGGGPQGRRGATGERLGGFVITPASRPPLPGLLRTRLLQQGFEIADRPAQARFAITVTADVISVRPAAVGRESGAVTADYKAEVTVVDRQQRRSHSREFDGQVLSFGDAAARQDAVKKVADQIVEFVSELMKAR
jgi:hypothetical protein